MIVTLSELLAVDGVSDRSCWTVSNLTTYLQALLICE
jgi:hypothetical protein